MKKLLGLAVLAFGVNGYALTATPVGTEIAVSYIEPTLNADGTTLTDLSKTTVYYQIDGSTTPIVGREVPALTVTGGSTINTVIVVPALDGREGDVSVWATATDRSGNESGASNVETMRIDMLAPAAPQ